MPNDFKTILKLSAAALIGGVVILFLLINFFKNLGASDVSLMPGLLPSLTQEEKTEKQETVQNPSYSFDRDDDNDGLSNAKEIIYGADPKNPDTDNDKTTDGQEVQNGYDPIVGGMESLQRRASLNLTIAYFLWLTEKTNEKDPRLVPSEIELFLSEKTSLEIDLPEVSLGEIKLSASGGREAVREYLNNMAKIESHFPSQSYLEIASQVFRDDYETLGQTSKGLEQMYKDFKGLETPPEALEIQKNYIAVFALLKNLFNQLYRAKEDPVRVMYNAKRGEKLIQIIQNLEKEKQKLIK